MLSRTELETEIRQFVTSRLRWPGSVEELDAESSLIDLGLMDSLGLMKTAVFVHDRYGVVVEDRELTAENFDSLRSISGLVLKKLRN